MEIPDEIKKIIQDTIPSTAKVGDKFKLPNGREVVVTAILPKGAFKYTYRDYIEIGESRRKEEEAKREEETRKLEKKKLEREKIEKNFPYLDIDYVYDMMEDEK